MAKLTSLQVAEASSHVQETISLESGLELSMLELFSAKVLDSSHLDFNSSICFK
ncbi:hypothetical protein IKI14_03230 [bacterium]|nr:hypothetical protein [bacterium]